MIDGAIIAIGGAVSLKVDVPAMPIGVTVRPLPLKTKVVACAGAMAMPAAMAAAKKIDFMALKSPQWLRDNTHSAALANGQTR